MLSAQKEESKGILKQPRIFVVYGNEMNERFLYYVTVANHKLFTRNITEAVEVCFNFFCALNIKYPEECNTVWSFIQNTVFKISFENEILNGSVRDLIESLGI